MKGTVIEMSERSGRTYSSWAENFLATLKM